MPSFSLPPLLTDRLFAVNTLLQSIGESPVTSVDLSQSVDVQAADQALKEITLATQNEGWHWNREYDISLQPDSTHQIFLPSNCLSVALAYWEGNPGQIANVTPRGRQMYDLIKHTLLFTDSLKVDIKLALEWEEMPEVARGYITIRAAQLFQGRLQSSRTVQAVQDDDLQRARATLEQDEDEVAPLNQITGNRQVLYRLYGRLLRRRI